MKIILPLLTLIAISVVCRSAFSMTLSELNDAIDSAESGATVYITSDIEVTETIEINKKVLTLASYEGECFKLIRTSGLNGNVLKVSGSGCDVTIENLAIDGNIAAGKYSDRLVAVADYAKLSMKEGSSVANGLGCGIELYGQSVLNMYDGSAITNFTGVAGHYGIGIVIGTGGNYPPTVNMYGGVVADCHGNRTAGLNADWDGAIYLYGGNFRATGGMVTRNTSKQSVAGINAYKGKLLLSGSFTALGNIGGYANDVLFNESISGNEFQLEGNYTGSMTFKMKDLSLEDGAVSKKIWTSVAHTARFGWENCISEEDPSIGLDARTLSEGWYPTWKKRDIKFHIIGKWAAPTLSKALSEAEAGDTIEIFTDIKCDTAISIPKNITLRSGGDLVYVMRKMAAETSIFTVSSTSLMLENIILDGNAIAPSANTDTPMIAINKNGKVILGRGAIIRNAIAKTTGGAVTIKGNGAELIMEDGSLITSCKSNRTTPYGSVIRIGSGETHELPPRFEMRGGAITGNPLEGYLSGNTGYGGVVYVWNGIFDMSGGVISDNPVVPENTLENMCAGVVNYVGQVRISGSAVIADNGGSHPGLRANANQPVSFYGDFRGRVELQMGSPAEGAVISEVTAETDATGAWGLNSADGTLVGKVGENGDLVWAKPVGSVNGTRAAGIGDLQTILPGSLNPAAGEKLVLGGAAATLGGSLDLNFDPASLLSSGKLPLTVLAAAEGDTITGSWTFTLPEWSGKGGWFVRRSGDDFRLRWEPNGLAIRIR